MIDALKHLIHDNLPAAATIGVAVVLLIYPLYLVARKAAEHARWVRFRREFIAERAQRDKARLQAVEEYQKAGPGPARTYAAQGRRLPTVKPEQGA